MYCPHCGQGPYAAPAELGEPAPSARSVASSQQSLKANEPAPSARSVAGSQKSLKAEQQFHPPQDQALAGYYQKTVSKGLIGGDAPGRISVQHYILSVVMSFMHAVVQGKIAEKS